MKFSDKQIEILESSEKLFSKTGCDATSVRDIAKAANINVAMISYYFGSKENLIESLFRYRMQGTESIIETIVVSEELSVIEKLERLVQNFIANVFVKKDFYKVMMAEQVHNKNLKILNYIKDLRLKYAALFSRVIKQGIKSKDFTTEAEVVLLTTSLTGTVIQLVINMDYYKEYYGLEKLSNDDLEDMLQKKISVQLMNYIKTSLGYNDKRK